MATILNIETSTEVCSVALTKNGRLIGVRENQKGLNHSELLTVYIEELFQEHQQAVKTLDAVAVSMGPGSYTGLRIGVSVAKGLCYALDKPLIAVGTLHAMASGAAGNNFPGADTGDGELLLCPMIDARRMEVYTALYDQAGNELEAVSAKIIDSDPFPEYLAKHKILFFGNGAAKCKDAIHHPNALFDETIKASARFMLNLAEKKLTNREFESVAYFEPFYLKDFVATVPKNKIIP